ncbi:MAG TPA: leucyl aminopeptidase family protein [Rhizobiaceae bacterium]|nr:leucyl aminopeptidase family protein [Rhizobiaceae bacterium]
MSVELISQRSDASRPVYLIRKGRLGEAGLAPSVMSWARVNGFDGQNGRLLTVPDEEKALQSALFGLGDEKGGFAPLATGALAKSLPEGDWHFAALPDASDLATLGLLLGGYDFDRYARKNAPSIRFAVPEGCDAARVTRLAEGVFLARDLINTPTNDMGPATLEAEMRKLASRYGAEMEVVHGDSLVEANFPMIHAVGRASSEAPRLLDMRWGRAEAPKVTLVGKGVCFDTGGLDIKPASGMLLMKKDMGGAANVLGLALMIMAAKLDLRLRVLIPAVENAISGNAFRPGDVLKSRKGITVEIGNTDAEGRLILADALALADEEEPALLVDMATLTGAARVALGPDLPPFYTDDDGLAGELAEASRRCFDPLWRMPLWTPYEAKLSSRIADINNVTSDGFAGSVTAALFLKRFVEKTKSWVHFDIYGWNPVDRPHARIGGEAQGIRALEELLVNVMGLNFRQKKF